MAAAVIGRRFAVQAVTSTCGVGGQGHVALRLSRWLVAGNLQCSGGCGAAAVLPAAFGITMHSRTSSSSSSAMSNVEVISSSSADADDTATTMKKGARVFRNTRSSHPRVFQWGIGNKFRMQSANRYSPVHKAFPKEAMVREDYYESDNPNIVWENLNEAWEVYWYEHHKLNAKPFPVKKYGIERSKLEAQAFYDELAATNRLKEKPRHEPPQEGVFYDGRIQAWVSFFWREGRPLARSYSVNKYGYDGAKALAVAKQNDPVNGILRAHQGGGTPLTEKDLSQRAKKRLGLIP